MRVQMVRFRTSPEEAGEVEDAIATVMAAVHDAAPPGISYTACRVGDDPEFLLTLEMPDDENPLLAIPAAGAFRARIGEWAGGPVPPVTLHVIGRYTG